MWVVSSLNEIYKFSHACVLMLDDPISDYSELKNLTISYLTVSHRKIDTGIDSIEKLALSLVKYKS